MAHELGVVVEYSTFRHYHSHRHASEIRQGRAVDVLSPNYRAVLAGDSSYSMHSLAAGPKTGADTLLPQTIEKRKGVGADQAYH